LSLEKLGGSRTANESSWEDSEVREAFLLGKKSYLPALKNRFSMICVYRRQ